MKRTPPDYTKFAPELVVHELLAKILSKLTTSKVLWSLGIVGIIIASAVLFFYWRVWEGITERKFRIDKQLFEQDAHSEGSGAVNDDLDEF